MAGDSSKQSKQQSGIIDFKLLEQALASASDFETLKKVIVNAPFDQPVASTMLFLGLMTLMSVNTKTQQIDRIALTDNELAHNTLVVTVVPFDDIKIPLHHPDNILAQTIDDGKPRDTTDWYYTFTPAMTGQEARINQASAGIAYTAVYRLDIPDGGILSFSYYQYAHEIGDKQRAFMEKYSHMVSKAMSQKMAAKKPSAS